MTQQSAVLAVDGGTSLFEGHWPVWPRADAGTEAILREVLYSGRWAISGQANGVEPFEKRFAGAFAAFNGVNYCVPVSSGTAALIVALRALGVGYGDEVLVPGLTWVACASAALAVGAIPVFVDVDPATLAMCPESARTRVTSATSAMIVVHPYCTVANVDALCDVSRNLGIPMVEDCSQAAGSRWNGRRVGTFGEIGTFSMQESKVITCGEGGAVVTNDAELYDRMEQLRADGRRHASSPIVGGPLLEEVGDVQGQNYCLSEVHAAILVDRMSHLEGEIELRELNATHLRDLLSDVGGVTPLARPAEVDLLSYWRFAARLDLQAFGGWGIERIAAALTAELGIMIKPVDPPIVSSRLYQPLHSALAKGSSEIKRRLKLSLVSLPAADEARRTCLRIPHRVLLAGTAEMEAIANAFAKVRSAASSF